VLAWAEVELDTDAVIGESGELDGVKPLYTPVPGMDGT
jgi:hypothetical protein